MQLDLFEKPGAFLTVWTEAAHGDAELRRQATAAERSDAERIGTALRFIQPSIPPDAETIGLAIVGMIHRVWYFSRDGAARRGDLAGQVAQLLAALVDRPHR
jgi:hypothetical protein